MHTYMAVTIVLLSALITIVLFATAWCCCNVLFASQADRLRREENDRRWAHQPHRGAYQGVSCTDRHDGCETAGACRCDDGRYSHQFLPWNAFRNA